MIRAALSEFCREAVNKNEQYSLRENEIVVKESDVVKVILQQVAEQSCDLVIFGASKGLLSGISVGNTILKKSSTPTLVVATRTDASVADSLKRI